MAKCLNSIRYNIWSDTVELAGEETKGIEGSFSPMDYDSTVGEGELYCELFLKGILWDSDSVNFEITYPTVQCSLALPDSFNYGDSNLYTITLSTGMDYIPPGKLTLRQRD